MASIHTTKGPLTCLLLAASLAAASAPIAARAQPRETSPAIQQAETETEGAAKRFTCQDGGTILTRFVTEHGRLVAIVDAFDGEGPKTLAMRPYGGPPVQLIWSDGRRTLTWSPGVQIMLMDTAVHRMCGGGHHH